MGGTPCVRIDVAPKEIEKITKTIAEWKKYGREAHYPLDTRQMEVDLDKRHRVQLPKIRRGLEGDCRLRGKKGLNMATMNFNTTNSTYRQLLASGLSYQVPPFQRDYSVTVQQVQVKDYIPWELEPFANASYGDKQADRL